MQQQHLSMTLFDRQNTKFVMAKLPEVIIMGDFNFPGVQWNSTVSDTNEHLSCLVGLRDWINQYGSFDYRTYP